MKNLSLKTLSASALIVSMLLSSCQKEKLDTVTEKSPNSSKSEATLQQIFKRNATVFSVLKNGNVSFKNESGNDISSCATVSTDSTSMPRVTVINYGLTGCTGGDGITRKGKVIITYDGDYRDAGTYIITTFNHYYENDNEVTGSDTMRNDGLNDNDHVIYSLSTNYRIIYANNVGEEKDILSGTCEWLTGVSTETEDDDQYGYDILGNVTMPNGDLFTITTQSQLIKNLAPNCSFNFVQGKILFQHSMIDALLDFGNGSCDDSATWTENGVTSTIVLGVDL